MITDNSEHWNISIHTKDHLKNNKIKTSRYEWWNFIPKNLFEQLRNISNIYFIGFLIILSIPEVTVADSPIPFAIALIFVFVVTMVKDLITDQKRKQLDRKENYQKVELYDPLTEAYKDELSQNLVVGDIIKIKEGERIPADCILLKSSGNKNVSYVETKEIDGESNLKSKKCLRFDLIDIRKMTFKIPKPNPFIYKFEGSYSLDEKLQEMDYNNFLLRGTMVKNTEFVIGLVTYVGKETKIFLNNSLLKAKFSSLYRVLNVYIKWLLAIQIVLSILTAVGYMVWHSKDLDSIKYLEYSETDVKSVKQFFILFGRWNLIISQIPISITVLLEIIRGIQTFLMNKDPLLNENSKGQKLSIYNQELLEEIGQVDHIFSDKTGTLTTNKLSLNYIYADDKMFDMIEKIPNLNPEDFENKLNLILTSICLCQSVTVDKAGNYHASSPDELALLNYAKTQDYIFMGTEENEFESLMAVSFGGINITFKLLKIIEFTSERKRMSVIIQNPQGKIFVFTKGADEEILKRITNTSDELDKIKDYINSMTSQGLRTLCFAFKQISLDEFDKIEKEYEVALKENNSAKKTEIDQAIEQSFIFLGVTSVRDELQANLNEDLKFFKDCNIDFWVITGDKSETTISIGLELGLLNSKEQIIRLDELQEDSLEKVIERAELKIKNLDVKDKAALIVSGNFFSQACMNIKNAEDLIRLGKKCDTVLFCRFSPKQKSQVVDLYRKMYRRSSCLAIGDGSNDVSMIISASVGIGIRGEEGSQAARSSDFAIGEFRNLRPLIFKHGRENYRRNSMVLFYIMFANNYLTMTSTIWGFYSMLSGLPLFDDSLISYLQLLYTPFSVIIYATLDEETSAKELMTIPSYYEIGYRKLCFTARRFWWTEINSAIQGIWPFVFMCLTFELSAAHENGKMTFYWSMGTSTFFSSVIVINLYLIMHSYKQLVSLWLAFLVSLIFFNLTFASVSLTSESDMYNTIQDVWTMPYFHLTNLLNIIVCLLPDFLYRVYVKLSVSDTR